MDGFSGGVVGRSIGASTASDPGFESSVCDSSGPPSLAGMSSMALVGGMNDSMMSSLGVLLNGVNFRRCWRFLMVSLPEPSIFTTYW